MNINNKEKNKIIEIIKNRTKDSIDISNDFNNWFNYLKQKKILLNYGEIRGIVYEILEELQNIDYMDHGVWDIDLYIDINENMEFISTNLYFNIEDNSYYNSKKREYCINESIINEFYNK